MSFKFEKLEVWRLALEYSDLVYNICEGLPRSEDFNLRSQMTRAATSIALNIAEGSTSQSDAEQAKFLSYALRSLAETVACQHLIHRRKYLEENGMLREAYHFSEKLFAKIQAMRTSLKTDPFRESAAVYEYSDESTPF